jgi:hypothetical protein
MRQDTMQANAPVINRGTRFRSVTKFPSKLEANLNSTQWLLFRNQINRIGVEETDQTDQFR